eukprot:9184936-Pyramimonas_sp.AAC.1
MRCADVGLACQLVKLMLTSSLTLLLCRVLRTLSAFAVLRLGGPGWAQVRCLMRCTGRPVNIEYAMVRTHRWSDAVNDDDVPGRRTTNVRRDGTTDDVRH